MANRNLRLDLETNELNDEAFAANLHHELHARRQDSFEDLLKQNKVDTKEFNRPDTKTRREINYMNADHDFIPYEESDENLGENFEATPWIPPTIERAKEFKRKAIFRNGDARIDSVELVTAPDLGIGTSLYFQFAVTMGIVLLVNSFLSLPILIFVYNGQAISTEDRDVLGLYQYTLGNIGYDRESKSYATDIVCTGSGYSPGEICIHWNGNEISLSQAASVITAMEFLQIVVFFLGVAYLYMKSISVMGRAAKSSIAISDYSVMVTNIPPDTSDKELIEHFNQLYQLQRPDFLGRPALEEAEVVDNCDHTGDQTSLQTWVAECVLHKGIGGFISSFKSKQHVLRKLYRARAKMKMYAENSPHADGFNQKMFEKAEKEMLATAHMIDALTEHNIKKWKMTFIPTDEDGKALIKRQVSNPESIYYNLHADSVAAFMVFEYVESTARCVRDYEKYAHFPMSLFYPEHLKFRGRAIHVIKAPEPDQIVWENIEVPFAKKMYLRVRTNLITLVLVFCCFVIILEASIYKSIFANKVPSGKLCTTTIPAVYANGSISSNYELVRPPTSARLSLDVQCQERISSSFYAVYSTTSNYLNPAVNYTLAACSVNGVCPIYGSTSYCPCVSLDSDAECDNAFCSTIGQSSASCSSFSAGDIGSCFCLDELKSTISTKGIATTMNRFHDLGSGSCKRFFGQYTVSVGLTYASVFTTTLVNVLLRKFLKLLALQEAHTSSDAEQGSIMTKIFLSNYATMAIIVLLAYGKSNNLPTFFEQIHIFDGPYLDFTTAWYGNIGFYLMTTFILQSFSPLMANLVNYFFIHPVLRWYHHSRVAETRSHSIVMQHDLNMLEVGAIFDPTDHTAQLLTLLFFSMTYAPGLPLLTPLCCFAFALYFRVDKVLLCRYFQKPPQVGDAAIRNVLALLPYAVIIRLGIACWMYGNQDILTTSSTSDVGGYNKFLATARESSSGYSYAQDRIFRPNVFPLFVLLLAVIAITIIRRLWHQLPIYWIFRILDQLRRFVLSNDDVFSKVTKAGDGKVSGWELLRLDDPLRQQSAGLTKDYFRYVKHRDEIPDTCLKMFSYAYLTQMSEIEVEEGWKIEDRGDFVVKIKIWREEHRRSDGSKLRVGTLKRTYEVIADHRCNSYNIEKVPAYYVAMRGLREGAASMMEQAGLDNGKVAAHAKGFFNDDKRSSGKDLEANVLDQAVELRHKDKHHHGDRHHAAASSGTVAVDASHEHRPRTKGGDREHGVDRPMSEQGRSRGHALAVPEKEPEKKAPKTANTHIDSSGAQKKNFTFDDFEGMEMGGQTALTSALERERLEKEHKVKEEEEKAHKKAEKDKKKHKH